MIPGVPSLASSVEASAKRIAGDDARSSSVKNAGYDIARLCSPAVTLERVRPLLSALGITRVANLTGLDRAGIPVVAVVRPNSRSYSVAQGKGLTLEAAKASGIMESIENYHAEETSLSLRLGSWRELRRRFLVAEVRGLPRLATSKFTADARLLWAEGGVDLVSGETALTPYEMVHLDFRSPRAQGSGCFIASSNGLASGNHVLEALSHALCEVIERDANTLFHLSGEAAQRERRIDLGTVRDPACRALIDRLDAADIDVLAWNTTTDIAVPSVACDVVDRDEDVLRPMPPVRGSGTHPSRRVALSRALTEAAQGRLTRISGSRDDLFGDTFDDTVARRRSAAVRAELRAHRATVSFDSVPDINQPTVEEDVQWICGALQAAGLRQIIALNLTRPDIGVPVVRAVVPYLEAMSEMPGFVPGTRARRAMEGAR